MFKRKGALEPGIEHAMWKNKVRHGGFVKALPDGKAVVLPDAIDDYAIEFVAVFFEPLRQATRVAVIGEALAESVHGKRLVAQPRRVRFIQGDELALHDVLWQSFSQPNYCSSYAARFGSLLMQCFQT